MAGRSCSHSGTVSIMFVPLTASLPPIRPMAGPPASINKTVLAFCSEIGPGAKPVYLHIEPERDCQALECFVNVQRKVEREGGRIQFGWEIYMWPGVFIEANHHAVYEGPNGPPWRDITPPTDEELQETRLFLPDDSAVYDFTNPLFYRDNIRKALVADSHVNEYLMLAAEIAAITRRTPGTGLVTIEGPDAERLHAIVVQSHHLTRQIAMKYTPWNDPCFCGRPEKFKRCHGSPAQRKFQP